MATVRVVRMIDMDIAVIRYDDHRAVWTLAHVRRESRCAMCKGPIRPPRLAFRPLGNQKFRRERIHRECVVGEEREDR